MKTVLVTGGSGYIGTNLYRYLQGWNVEVLDLIMPNYKPQAVYLANICGENLPTRHYDAVVHLAALVKVGQSESNKLDYWKVNVEGTLNLIKNLNYDNFVFASTSQAGLNNWYSTTKICGEKIVETIPHYSILRFANVIGGVNTTNTDSIIWNLNRETFRVHGTNWNTHDGTCVRDYVDVEDICNHIAATMEYTTNTVEVLGSGMGYSVLDLVRMNREINGLPKQLVYSEPRSGDIETNLVEPSPTFKSTKNIRDTLYEHSTGLRPTP